MARIKGLSIVTVQRFVEERHGRPAWDQLLTTLPSEERELWTIPLASGWYDLAAFVQALRWIGDTFYEGRPNAIEALGAYSAEQELTTVHRLLLRFASPFYLIEKTSDLWNRYYDTGRWEVTRLGKNAVRGTLYDMGVVDEVLCQDVSGYMKRAIELMGAKGVTHEHPSCRARGAPGCEHVLRWL